MIKFMRQVTESIGEDKLVFKPLDLDTYLARTGTAMAMLLDNTPIFLLETPAILHCTFAVKEIQQIGFTSSTLMATYLSKSM